MNGPCRTQISPGCCLNTKKDIHFSWTVDCFPLLCIKKGTDQIYRNSGLFWVPLSLNRALQLSKMAVPREDLLSRTPNLGELRNHSESSLSWFKSHSENKRNLFRYDKRSNLTSLGCVVLVLSEILVFLGGLMVKASSWRKRTWTKHVLALDSARFAYCAKHRLLTQTQSRKCWYFGKYVIYTQKLGLKIVMFPVSN